MKQKLIKIWNTVWDISCDIFSLFVFLMCATLAVNLAISNPRYAINALIFSVVGYAIYRLKTKKGSNHER